MILFEIGGLPEAAARDCLAQVAYKMPFHCRFGWPATERRLNRNDEGAGELDRESEAMKPAEMRAMSDEQLGLTLKDTIKNLFHLRVPVGHGPAGDAERDPKAKRDIARIKTIQRRERRG